MILQQFYSNYLALGFGLRFWGCFERADSEIESFG
jgi:hypothetical protein